MSDSKGFDFKLKETDNVKVSAFLNLDDELKKMLKAFLFDRNIVILDMNIENEIVCIDIDEEGYRKNVDTGRRTITIETINKKVQEKYLKYDGR